MADLRTSERKKGSELFSAENSSDPFFPDSLTPFPVAEVIREDKQDIGRLILFGFYLSSDGGSQHYRYRQDACSYFRERLHHSCFWLWDGWFELPSIFHRILRIAGIQFPNHRLHPAG